MKHKIEKSGLASVVLEYHKRGFSYAAIARKLADLHKCEVAPMSVQRFLVTQFPTNEKKGKGRPKAKPPSPMQIAAFEPPKKDENILTVLSETDTADILLESCFLNAVKLLANGTSSACQGFAPLPIKEAVLAEKIAGIIDRHLGNEIKKAALKNAANQSTETSIMNLSLSELDAEIQRVEKSLNKHQIG